MLDVSRTSAWCQLPVAWHATTTHRAVTTCAPHTRPNYNSRSSIIVGSALGRQDIREIANNRFLGEGTVSFKEGPLSPGPGVTIAVKGSFFITRALDPSSTSPLQYIVCFLQWDDLPRQQHFCVGPSRNGSALLNLRASLSSVYIVLGKEVGRGVVRPLSFAQPLALPC